jgi:predicted Zn-dependent protease
METLNMILPVSERSLRVLAVAAFALSLVATAPFAIASGDDTKSDANQTCPKGQVWDAKTKKCVEKKSGVLPDEALTDYAYALAKAERYNEALDVLDTLQNPNTAKALNYRGYATRKLGHTQEGVSYYLKSVALDPSYTKVREYLGEAYVIQGKLDLAKDQLATIAKLCGSTQCEEYGDLSQAITKAQGL